MAADDDTSRDLPWLGSPWVLGGLAAALVGVWAWAATSRFPLLNHDVAAVTHVSQRILGGERLYVDLPQPNLPLPFLVQAIPAALADALGTWLPGTVWAFLAAFVLGSWGVAAATLRAVAPEDWRGAGGVALLVLLVLLTADAGYEFGQREVLLFAALAPYLIAVSGAATGRRLPGGLAVAVGLLAGVGFGIKPHYPPVWFALEAWAALRTRSLRTVLRPENVVMVAFLTAYGLYVLLGTGWLPGLSLWTDSYRPFGALGKSLERVVHIGDPTFLASALGAWGVVRAVTRRQATLPLDDALALALPLLALAYVAQGKGFRYQALPAWCAAWWLVALTGLRVARALPRGRWLGLAVLLLPAWMVWDGDDLKAATGSGRVWAARWDCKPQPERKQPKSDGRCSLDRLLRQVDDLTEPGDPIAWVSPTVMQAGYVQTFVPVRDVVRVIPMLLPELYTRQERKAKVIRYHPDGERSPGEELVLRSLAEDLTRERPVLVAFDVRRNLRGFGATRFDLVTFYRQDPRTAALLDDAYVEVDDVSAEGAVRWFLRRDRADALAVR